MGQLLAGEFELGGELGANWYVTHAGLLRIANRNRCSGLKVQFIRELSNPPARRFAFEATAFKSKTCL
jgi:hypothetical protein